MKTANLFAAASIGLLLGATPPTHPAGKEASPTLLYQVCVGPPAKDTPLSVFDGRVVTPASLQEVNDLESRQGYHVVAAIQGVTEIKDLPPCSAVLLILQKDEE